MPAWACTSNGGGASISGAGALGSHVDTGYPPGLYPDTHHPSQKGTSSHWFFALCAGGGGESRQGIRVGDGKTGDYGQAGERKTGEGDSER